MKISRHTHSCLLIEENNQTILIDPGVYSTIKPSDITNLDYILLTHEHADHMAVPLIKEMLSKFSSAKVISNESVSKALQAEGAEVTTQAVDGIELSTVQHEDILAAEPPLNTQFDLFGKLSHPGDSHSFTTTQEVLALPVSAPWGSLVNALKLAIKLQPKTVLPIHDWHWNDQARQGLYQMAEKILSSHNIKFVPLTDGEVIEV